MGMGDIVSVFCAAGMRSRGLCVCAGWVWLVAAARLCACDVPVFKYALQMWPADAYELVVAHCGGEEASALLAELREAAGAGANLAVREAAPEEVREKYGVALEEGRSGGLPWLIVRYPVRMETRGMVWAGPAAAGDGRAWLDSPVRREIARLLRGGSVGAWLFLESGDSARDETAYALLKGELARLGRVMRLPDEPDAKGGVRFELLRLAREEPAEKALLRMLIQSEPDLEGLSGQPMVFPVYGRGLVLYALVGAGINTVTITETAEFLAGECSCEIKSQNPGLELLMTADWEGENNVSLGLAGFSERASLAEERLEAAAAPATEEADRGAAAAPRAGRVTFIMLLILAAGVMVGAFLWRGRDRG